MENTCKSHTSTILFPSPFSIRVQVCSCLLCPVMPSLLHIDLMGSPVRCLGGSPQHPMGVRCAGHLHHHQSHLLSHCHEISLLSILYSSLQLFFFITFFHQPTYYPPPMFSSLVPVLPHAHLNTVFPTALLRQTQPILVLLMQLPRYKWPCIPKPPPNYSVHAG